MLQIIALFFNISLSLPKQKTANDIDLESSYGALSSLEDIVSIIRRVSVMYYFTVHLVLFCEQIKKIIFLLSQNTSVDQIEVFHRVVSSVCILLSRDEVK